MAADRILVLGLMGRYPLAGVAWQALHYVVGLERLGFEVYYVEDSRAPPYDPRTNGIGTDATYNVEFVRSTMARTARPDHWAYWDSLTARWHGLPGAEVEELYGASRQIWNVCGATRLRDEHARGATRVYVQTDPGIEQVALASGDREVAAAIDAHDVLFTYGENLVRPGAILPSGGRTWHATRPPVLLDAWSAPPARADAAFSTVGSWRNRGKDVAWDGVTFGWSKHRGFLDVLDVPRRARVPVEAAMAPPAAVARRMIAGGWRLRDPAPLSADLDAYRAFLQESAGEFTVAKDVYVRSRSGWFSDRSACYLAAGRPVVTQSTGFEALHPSSDGAIGFRGAEDAVTALRSAQDDLDAQGRAARRLAEERFDAARVLAEMVEAIEAAGPKGSQSSFT